MGRTAGNGPSIHNRRKGYPRFFGTPVADKEVTADLLRISISGGVDGGDNSRIFRINFDFLSELGNMLV